MNISSTCPETRIINAKSTLMFTNPFFGMLCVHLPVIECIDIETMATDGKSLFFNPEFVTGLSKAELVFVLAHEILHNAFEHHVRRQHREPKLWNVACDYAINGELVECKFTMPKGGLLDARFTGLSAEEIYRILQNEGTNIPDQADPGACGQVLDAADPHDTAEIQRATAEARMQVAQAAAVAMKEPGKLSANLQRMIGHLLKPNVDWRAVMRRFIDESSSKDYSWMRPNRRFLPEGIVVPGLIPDGIPHLTVAIDTSGSIDDDILNRFATEINAAFGEGAVDKITVIYADSSVRRVDDFEIGDEIVFNPVGGGGTAFSQTFNWIQANRPDTKAIMYFTDLYVSDFGRDLGIPTLWAVHGDSREYELLTASVPFGECIGVGL